MKPRIGYYYWVLNYKEPLRYEGSRKDSIANYGVFRFSDGGAVRIDVDSYLLSIREYNP